MHIGRTIALAAASMSSATAAIAQQAPKASASTSVSGVVRDDSGAPVAGAEVFVAGANRRGVTDGDGRFRLDSIAAGTYILRVRKLGYAPHLQAVDVSLRTLDRSVELRRLPTKLDPVVTTERSGFGRDSMLLRDLDQRRRWHGPATSILGPEALERFHDLSLDLAVRGMDRESARRRAQPGRPRANRALTNFEVSGDACVLINGKLAMRRSLSQFRTSDLQLLEVYPSGTEVTGTVAARMPPGSCEAQGLFDHPTYFVLWLKDAKP
jgi:hypothetical protein